MPSQGVSQSNINKKKKRNKKKTKQDAVEQQAPVDVSFDIQVEFPNLDSDMKERIQTHGWPVDTHLTLKVLPNTMISEIKQSIFDTPHLLFYTCFSLYYKGNLLSDAATLGDIPDYSLGDKLQLIPDEYAERDVYAHVARFRDVMTDFGKECWSKQGYNYAAAQVSSVCREESEPTVTSFTCRQAISPWSVSLMGESTKNTLDACVKSIQLSAFHPPTFHRKMAGDVMYLSVETCEGEHVQVVASKNGFYTCLSSLELFDPTPSSPFYPTLPGLLMMQSSGFIQLFPKYLRLPLKMMALEGKPAKIQELELRHSAETIPSLFGVYPWLVEKPIVKADPGQWLDRWVDTQLNQEQLYRDWNEELASIEEFVTETGHDRLMKESLACRQHAEFVQAVIKGVELILNGTLTPYGTQEPSECRMFIHNNIFFTEGLDATREYYHEMGGNEAVHVALSKDIDGIARLKASITGLHTSPTVIVDWFGKRFVGQSIIPGLLKKAPEESQEPMIRYGSDGEGQIMSDATFEPLAEKVAQALRLKKHQVINQEGAQVTLHTSVDTKGLKGADGRYYFLELARSTPVDIEFLDQVKSLDYPHQMCLLRWELLDEFCMKKQKESPETPVDIRFNPDAFTPVKQVACAEDEALVREASIYLRQVVLPNMLAEFKAYPTFIPLDSLSLTRAFHQRGINMRYLGTFYKMLEKEESNPFVFLKTLLVEEMLVRAAKKLVRPILAQVDMTRAAAIVSEVLNCFCDANYTTQEPLLQACLTGSLLETLLKHVSRRFLVQLNLDTIKKSLENRMYPLVRSFCLCMGIQLEQHDYDFVQADADKIFLPRHILNLVPLIKSASPKSMFADEIYEHGRLALIQGNKETAMELLQEAIVIYEQSNSMIHPETARVYATMATLMFQTKQVAAALEYQQKAVIAYERVYGLDHPDTLQHYMNLAYFENALGNSSVSLKLMRRALDGLLVLDPTAQHPEFSNVDSNLGVIYQQMEKSDDAAGFLLHALEQNKALFGEEHIITAGSYQSLTRNCILQGDFRSAIRYEKSAYNNLKKLYGEQDPQTVNCFEFIKLLTARAVAEAKKQVADGAPTTAS